MIFLLQSICFLSLELPLFQFCQFCSLLSSLLVFQLLFLKFLRRFRSGVGRRRKDLLFFLLLGHRGTFFSWMVLKTLRRYILQSWSANLFTKSGFVTVASFLSPLPNLTSTSLQLLLALMFSQNYLFYTCLNFFLISGTE